MNFYSFFPVNIYHSSVFYFLTSMFCGKNSTFLCKIILFYLSEKNPSLLNYDDIPHAFYYYISPRASLKNVE